MKRFNLNTLSGIKAAITWLLRNWRSGGGGGGGGSVVSVTGTGVNNSDPTNPKIDTPDLQKVTNVGNTTTTDITANSYILGGGSGQYNKDGIFGTNNLGADFFNLSKSGISIASNYKKRSIFINPSSTPNDLTFWMPERVGTLALLEDIPTTSASTLQDVLTNGNTYIEINDNLEIRAFSISASNSYYDSYYELDTNGQLWLRGNVDNPFRIVMEYPNSVGESYKSVYIKLSDDHADSVTVDIDLPTKSGKLAIVGDAIENTTDTFTSTPKIMYINSLTQAEFDGLVTPDVNTLFITL